MVNPRLAEGREASYSRRSVHLVRKGQAPQRRGAKGGQELEEFQEIRGREGRPSSAAAPRGDARPPYESGYIISEFGLDFLEILGFSRAVSRTTWPALVVFRGGWGVPDGPHLRFCTSRIWNQGKANPGEELDCTMNWPENRLPLNGSVF